MATEIHEEIVVLNEKNETTLKIYITGKGQIALSEGDDIDNPCSFFTIINKRDWDDINDFVCNQLK